MTIVGCGGGRVTSILTAVMVYFCPSFTPAGVMVEFIPEKCDAGQKLVSFRCVIIPFIPRFAYSC
ncbi:hypothetical protein EYS39_14520 [Cronobacter sakazakii]|nr:hypothetical protein EYS39_14520 [Cronobacter sakazakii]